MPNPCDRCEAREVLRRKLVSLVEYMVREFPELCVGDVIGELECAKLQFWMAANDGAKEKQR